MFTIKINTYFSPPTVEVSADASPSLAHPIKAQSPSPSPPSPIQIRSRRPIVSSSASPGSKYPIHSSSAVSVSDIPQRNNRLSFTGISTAHKVPKVPTVPPTASQTSPLMMTERDELDDFFY